MCGMNNEISIIKSAADSFVNSDIDDIGKFFDALEKLYIFRALEADVENSDKESASKLIKIAIPLESTFHHKKDAKDEEKVLAYNLLASIFEYAARVNSDEKAVSSDYWLRASIAYLHAKKSANSIVCVKQAEKFFVKENNLEDELYAFVFLYLSREIPDVLKTSMKLIFSLEKEITEKKFSTMETQFFMLGALELTKSITFIAHYLKFGLKEGEEFTWNEHMEIALEHFQKAGNENFIWLTSRLLTATQYLLENSLWSLSSLIPKDIIKAFTQNKKAPIYELWEGQIDALKNMIVPRSKKHQSLIMPPSSGKTIVATILAAKELLENSGNCFYVTPFKALVSEVAEFMNKYLPSLGINIRYLPGKYDAIPNLDTMIQENARLFVLTPEKMDLLWRLNDPRLKDTRLFIFDEVQNVSAEGRGLLLELLISRIKENYGFYSRIVLLSAVIPSNSLVTLIEWLGNKYTAGKKIDWAPTRESNAIFFRKPDDNHRSGLFYNGKFTIWDILPPDPKIKRRAETMLLTLRYLKHLSPVLVYCGTKSETESMAELIHQNAPFIETDNECEKAAKYVEKIMGKQIILPDMIRAGIAYHHASLPNSIKQKIEQLGRDGMLRVLCCTSTLMEGVNLNVHTVIINNVYQGSTSMEGLQLRNLAGRAGRALRDTEGHTVLMESSFNAKLTNEDYSSFQSRFFQYLLGLSSDPEYVKDVSVIESDLLARFYKNEFTAENLDEKSKKILQSTMFAKQASAGEFVSALGKIRNSAKNIISIPNLKDIQLKVFAETGLGIKECQYLDEKSQNFKGKELAFRVNKKWNIEQIMEIINASILPNPKFSTNVLNRINDKQSIILNWLLGTSIHEMAKMLEKTPSNKTFNTLISFLYGYVADEVSWTNAGLLRLIDVHTDEKLQSLDYEYYILPSYLKYGVNTPAALLLCLAGLEDRDEANRVSVDSPMINNSGENWIEIINWVLNLPSETFGQVQENLLDNLSQLIIPLKDFKGYKGTCEIDSDGNLIQNGKQIAKLDNIAVKIMNLLKDKTSVTKHIETVDDKAFLQIDYA